MYTRISHLLLAATLFAPPLLAQTAPTPTAGPAQLRATLPKATTGELSKPLDERLLFFREMYKLDRAQLAKARAEMTVLAGKHKTYMDAQQTMLRRLSKAILLILPSQPDLTNAQKETIRRKLQRDIHRIHAEAPLSYTAVAKLVEKSLSKDVIARSREQMAARFAKQLEGAAMDINNLDALVIPPLRPSTRIATAPTPTRAANLKAKPPARTPSKATRNLAPSPGHQAHPQLPPPPKGTLSSLRTEKPILAAPPIDDWPETMKASATKYGFSSSQNESADFVLGSCRKRAEVHLAARKLDYDKVKQLTDPQVKAKRIKELNRKVDELYHELNQRIDSIASLEQRLASRAADKKTPVDKEPIEKKPVGKTTEKKTTAKSDLGK